MVQAPTGSSETIGFAQRWDRNPGGTSFSSTDVAAAFMDNNTVERDGSLLADRVLEAYGSFDGAVAPSAGTVVTVVSADPTNVGRHTYSAVIIGTDLVDDVDNGICVSGTTQRVQHQIHFLPSQTCVTGGDSGSPIVDMSRRIVGMVNWGNIPDGCNLGGGTNSPAIVDTLTFDKVPGSFGSTVGSWYGTNTTDLSVQMYPSFRTIVQGQGACAWAFIKNTGTVPAQNVAIQNTTAYAPQPTFDYLNPAGFWNTPYTIPAGQTAQFAVCMTLNQPQIPINWIPNFYGTTAAAPVIKAAHNTFATRWTSTSLPDPAVSTATLSNDDIVHTNGPSGTGAFSLTVLNVGASGPVTITLDTDWGYGGLPYTLWVCEISAQAQCITPLLPSLSVHLPANEPRYFTVLAQGQGQPVALDPYYNRIYFRIREGLNQPTGTLVGAAGLSITTN